MIMAIDCHNVSVKGINFVRALVEEQWSSDWQEISQQNDDCYDGVVFLRKRRRNTRHKTSGILSVQIKTGSGYKVESKKRPGIIGINVGKDYIEKHKRKWKETLGPSILVFVEEEYEGGPKYAWWTDLKLDTSFSTENRNLILIDSRNQFGEHSKGDMFNLCGINLKSENLPEVTINRSEDEILTLQNKSFKKMAREYYVSWQKSGSHNQEFGSVVVTRLGWKHMTRKSKSKRAIYYALMLLPIARKIIQETSKSTSIGRLTEIETPDKKSIYSYLGLRARIKSEFRNDFVVQVILRREKVYNKSLDKIETERIKFFTTYELK